MFVFSFAFKDCSFVMLLIFSFMFDFVCKVVQLKVYWRLEETNFIALFQHHDASMSQRSNVAMPQHHDVPTSRCLNVTMFKHRDVEFNDMTFQRRDVEVNDAILSSIPNVTTSQRRDAVILMS